MFRGGSNGLARDIVALEFRALRSHGLHISARKDGTDVLRRLELSHVIKDVS